MHLGGLQVVYKHHVELLCLVKNIKTEKTEKKKKKIGPLGPKVMLKYSEIYKKKIEFKMKSIKIVK